MIICPNFSNPDVARDFNELKEATSEKAAYAIWSLNNGNSIDKAPNGAKSKLFEDLLRACNNNRKAAIREKAKVYSIDFMNWFGDWINDPANASKVVDENGEPLVVYRIDTSDFTIFDKSKLETTRKDFFGIGFYFSNDLESVKTHYKEPDREPRSFFLNVRSFDTYDYQEPNLEGEIPRDRIITFESADDFFLKEFIVKNPNQIKSATDNNGMFSTENDNILLHADKKVNGTKGLSDVIEKEGATGVEAAENVVNFLRNKFPALRINFVDDVDDIHRDDTVEEDILKGILRNNHNKSIVYHGEVYLLRSRLSKQGGQIASEEILHMLIKTLQTDNKNLFESLLREARKNFKKLTVQIEHIYKDAGQDTIDNEIVTQALARYVNRDIQNNNHKRFADFVRQFVEWLKSIILGSSDKIGETVYIDPTKLKSLTLQEFSDLINAEDTRFDINIDSDDTFYHTTGSITRQIYDLGVQIDTERQQYINSVLNQYKINNPNASTHDLQRVQNNARRQFDLDRSNQLMKDNQIRLAQHFGMHLNLNGFYESSEISQRKLMLEYFINSLQNDTYKTYNLENINRSKYEQVGSVEGVTSLSNVIYTALYDGDLTTLDKELARDYVRMFWGSDLIQAALKSLDDGHKTSKELEDLLVNNITRDPVSSRNTDIVDWLRNMWATLNNLVKNIINTVLSDQQKQDILKAVDASYMIAEDLEYTNSNQMIYDREDGNMSSSIFLSEKDKDILSNIKSGIKTRLKSQLSRNVKNQRLIADLKTRLEIIDGANQESIDDVYNIIQDFLVNANQEIGRTRSHIDNTLLIQIDMDNWNPQEINFIQQDLIGYYKNMLDIVSSLFSDKMSSINKFNQYRVANDPNAINLENFVNQLLYNIEMLQSDYNARVVKPYVRKVLTDFVNKEDAVTDKGTFIYNMEKWLEQDTAYGDLAAGEVLIGMASRSKSPIVRIVEKMMSEAEYATSRQTLKKGNELIRKYNELRPIGSQISPYNWQKRFMEFDRNDVPTGYFIRDINYGQFYRDKDEKEQELRIKYGLSADEDGNTIFNDEDFTKNDSVYNRYHDELDEWLDKHCERRYTLDYYKAKRRFMSPKTLIAKNQLQRQIDLILDKCRTQLGFVDLSRLTQNEKRQLDLLRRQKRDLGSHYIFTDVNGVLSVEEKTGDALKIAEEISRWNKYITDKVKYKPDWTAFNRAKAEIEAKYGKGSQEVIDFERNNTTMRITSDFYDLLHDVVGTAATNQELENLKKRHSEIINALKDREGAGSHSLNKLGLGLNTDQSGWKELQRIEQRMADIKRQLKLNGAKGIAPTNNSLTFDQIAKMKYITKDDNSNEYFVTYLYNQWRQAAASDTNLINVFNQLFTYTDSDGKIKYLNAFRYLTPNAFSLNVNGRVINCIENRPGSEYSELDESSIFVNKNFVKNGKSMQPKNMYRNKDFDELNANEKEFLNMLLNTMDEANSMIPNKALDRDYMLPQISGRTMSVLSNTLRNKELQTGLKYSFRKFGVKYAETTGDVSTNTDLARRPDGTVVNNIPIRFINKLDNPSVQTTDVLGSVIMFYDMACNYSNKSKNLPTLELIKYAIKPDTKSTNRMEDQYAKVENMLDQRYYGKETSFGFDSNEKITESKQRTIQGVKTIRNTAAVAMLGINFTTIEVGYIDAMCSMLCDAVAGKYITNKDMLKAFCQCIGHTRKMLQGLGNPVVNDKLVAAMQYNQLSRSNSEIFAMTDKFKLDKFVHDHLLMGGYTITDYMVNSMMLTATYNHYRLIHDPKTGRDRFYSKTDAINEFTKLGYTEKEAVKLWKKAKTTLWDAYDVVDGYFTLKDSYKNIVDKKLEDRVAGRLRDRTAMYNGVMPQTEKAKLQQNVFGSFLTLMRNFYINTYWDRFKTGGDYVTEDGDHKITWQSEYKRDDLGLVNLETGEFEGAVFKDFCRGMYKIVKNAKMLLHGETVLTEPQRYAVERSATEFIIIGGLVFLMLWSISFARTHNYDDDKTPAWSLNLTGDNKGLHFNMNNMDDKFADWARWKLALLATRGFTERLTPWTPQVGVELFTSPSVVTSYLDDVGQMWGLVNDLFSQRIDEEIKSGGYKHMTRGTRDILKIMSFTGVDNIVRSWHTDGIKSTLNYYRSLAPTSSFVQTQSEWNEEHGLGSHGSKKKNKSKSTLGDYAD